MVEINNIDSELREENDDFEKDIIDLIEINNYGKKDLIAKMKRLCEAHKKERDKIFGEAVKKRENMTIHSFIATRIAHLPFFPFRAKMEMNNG